jgi:ATP-binding cassette subfamily F protein uup
MAVCLAVWSARDDRKFVQRLRYCGFAVEVEHVRARLKKGGPHHVIFLAHKDVPVMPPLINAQQISKTFGIVPLFHELSFTVSEGDRIGVIGPNGAGKSTLLQILAGRLQPDSGDVAVRKRTRLSYVAQHSEFSTGQTVKSIVENAMERSGVPEAERQSLMGETLGRAGFVDFQVAAASLSGGWRKRLAIVEGLVQAPDVLFLDEPTNHLDLAGIKWLETVLQSGQFACVTVSHDRYLLENAATDVVELKPRVRRRAVYV